MSAVDYTNVMSRWIADMGGRQATLQRLNSLVLELGEGKIRPVAIRTMDTWREEGVSQLYAPYWVLMLQASGNGLNAILQAFPECRPAARLLVRASRMRDIRTRVDV